MFPEPIASSINTRNIQGNDFPLWLVPADYGLLRCDFCAAAFTTAFGVAAKVR